MTKGKESLFNMLFDATQLSLLSAGIILFLTSVVFFTRKKYTISVTFLFLSSVFVYLFAALLDPFLNLWDERFHALVGKNLMEHPLKPTLYDTMPVDIAYDRWDRFHVWLHKQPLFLWQIALSFKLFGVNEIALRLPSALLSACMVLVGYRSGSLLVNKRVGYYTAILFVSSFYITELVAGRQQLDHNDISFLAYVSLSLWAWLEYVHSDKKYWLLLIGIFSGFAILCKWLVGLLVFFGWAVFNFIQYKWKIKNYGDLALSVIVALVIAVPWQVLTFYWYPTEAEYEMTYNAIHFSTAVEGHIGDGWFHIEQIGPIFGMLVPFVLLPGLYFFYKKTLNKNVFYAFLANVLIVELFFAFAATKMPSFTVILALPVFLIVACFIDELLIWVEESAKSSRISKVTNILFLLLLVLFRFDVEKLQDNHTSWKNSNPYVEILTYNRGVFMDLNNSLPENTVLVNVKGRHYIEAMFHTNFPAYNIIPTFEQYEKLNQSDYTIAVFPSVEDTLPDYLTQDKSVIILPDFLKGYN